MELGYEPKIILSGRGINDEMPQYIAKKIIQNWLSLQKNPSQCSVLIMGATFKENVADIRNSKVFDLIKELKEYSVKVDIIDPHADATEVLHEYNVKLNANTEGKYDAVIIAVAHREYVNLGEKYFLEITNHDAMIVDLKNLFKNKIKQLQHWTL